MRFLVPTLALLAAMHQAPVDGHAAAPPAAAGTEPPGSSPPVTVGGPPVGDLAEPFEETIEVSVVSIDVVVRDGEGNLVRGLTRADFKLFVDGRQVEISNFSATEPEAAKAATPPPAAQATPLPLEPAAPPQHLALVLFVDNANMRPFDRNRLFKQIRTFLQKTLTPGDRVLLVTHDPGLHVRHSFRDDLASLAPTLDQIERESAVGLNRDISKREELDMLRDVVKSTGCSRAASQAMSQAHAAAESALADERETYASLHHLLRSLGGLDGRKALLYVGDGMATHAGMDFFGMIQDLCPSQSLALETLDATAPMRQVIADANANLVSLYTLEARGLDPYVSVEHAGRPLLSFETTRQVAIDRQDSLLNLARETGGRAAINGNDFSHDLEAISAELGTSYSLGFTPTQAGLGKAHQIRIQLDRPGLRASYRTSYRDRTPQERLEGQVEAALLHGQADNPLAASLKVGTATPAEHGRVLVPVQVRVPFAKLVLLPREDGRHGRVAIVVGDLDARGGMAPLQHMQLPLRIPEADAKRILSSHLGYGVKVLVEPGHQRLAFLIRDELARVSSCVTQEIEVDKAGTVNLVAAPPGTKATP